MFGVLLVYYALCFGLIVVLPAVRLWRQEKVNALVLPGGDGAAALIGVWFKGLVVAVAVLVVAAASGAPLDALGPLELFSHPVWIIIGWLLLIVTLAVIAAAQWQMGRSWRIGIDEVRPTALVAQGIFAYSRNPIFLAVRLNMLGLFLILPNAVTFAIAAVTFVLTGIQVRLEEAHLDAMLGEPYRQYRASARRWL